MNRRDVLVGLVSSALAAGHLPLLAGGRDEHVSWAKAGKADYPFEPIAGYVDSDPPLTKGGIPGDKYTLTYDILFAAGGPADPAARTHNVGTLRISRSLDEGGAPRYEVTRRIPFRWANRNVHSHIRCRDNPLNTPVSWTTRTTSLANKDTGGVTTEKGRLRKGSITLSGPCERTYTADNPVICWWTLLDFIARRADEDTHLRADYLREMSRFHQGQTLRYDGQVTLPRKQERDVHLKNYVQWGHGVAATNFLVDENGLPQLLTGMQTSWALKGIHA